MQKVAEEVGIDSETMAEAAGQRSDGVFPRCRVDPGCAGRMLTD